MAKRSRRNSSLGPVSRLASPVSRGLNLVKRTGSRALSATNSVWRTAGEGVRGVLNNATGAVNGVLGNVTSGRRRGGSRRSSKKNKTRKAPKRR
jgi:hypothetical protein